MAEERAVEPVCQGGNNDDERMEESSVCGSNAVKEERAKLYEGALIKESIEDETLLDSIRVHKVELWNTGGKPKY
ncbi:MAG: hypothetical protein GX234_01605 [Clostridiales bacterium]|nr:hypothetical protein [Clostridiales bacterium]